MSVIQGARERARREVTAAIKDEARRQLATEGAAKLSLRAVARELGMVSSALYRYFPSRDDLLTALIIDAYDAVGEAAEHALAEAGAGAAPVARWTAVCRAVRGWAVEHPHEYALIYGSPVPGYAAPQATTVSAARVGLALIGVVEDAYPADVSPAPAAPSLPQEVLDDAEELRRTLDVRLPAPVLAEIAAAWAELFGLVSFEVFGQFNRVIEARDAFFARAATRLAQNVGLAVGEE
ncbi:TetR/AcrR family transcriptional regulator [Streptomyces yunnanensis]|uniref:TetR/AcrR family transcriptional regulator n=1 Tax=Streptomyces yunnanensis TaxID=156453 RepID=A0ABY8A9C8_9ACTN|nr:TetR/AcrR family transcriptional regulator [Streptomyces yunnanensis]WEB41314.1 TetR/AcrR family transcriptional regulator [Streptomyces yunnanensis]